MHGALGLGRRREVVQHVHADGVLRDARHLVGPLEVRHQSVGRHAVHTKADAQSRRSERPISAAAAAAIMEVGLPVQPVAGSASRYRQYRSLPLPGDSEDPPVDSQLSVVCSCQYWLCVCYTVFLKLRC